MWRSKRGMELGSNCETAPWPSFWICVFLNTNGWKGNRDRCWKKSLILSGRFIARMLFFDWRDNRVFGDGDKESSVETVLERRRSGNDLYGHLFGVCHACPCLCLAQVLFASNVWKKQINYWNGKDDMLYSCDNWVFKLVFSLTSFVPWKVLPMNTNFFTLYRYC